MDKRRLHKIVRLLTELDQCWPDDLMLFSFSGRLCQLDMTAMEILPNDFPRILNDGGDPQIRIADDGRQFIDGMEWGNWLG